MRESLKFLSIAFILGAIGYVIITSSTELSKCHNPDSVKFKKAVTVIQNETRPRVEQCLEDKAIALEIISCVENVEKKQGTFLSDISYKALETFTTFKRKSPAQIKKEHNDSCGEYSEAIIK